MPNNIEIEIEEQIKEFDKLIKKYSFIEELYIGRAVLYTKIGEYEKAIKDYKRTHEDYFYDLVAVCLRHNLIKEVEEYYTKRIEKDKDNIVNYMSRARLYIRIGEDKKALADCESILKISPDNKFVLGIKEVITKKLKAKEKQGKQEDQTNIFLT